jgi:predicted nucleic acid-binding Zn ribbon protein
MPTYEFRCPDGTIIERVFKMSEVPDSIPSPDGKGLAVRIISGGADLIFKGSGFYITDYGKDGKRDLREKAGQGDAGKEAKGDKKPDAKSDVASAAPKETAADKPAQAEKKSDTTAKTAPSPKGSAE